MRICLVSREYPTDHWGGIGTYTEKTARALARLGQTVHVITEGTAGPSTIIEDRVTVHRLAPERAGLLGVPNTRTLARSRAVSAALHELPFAPDVVQACENGAEGLWYSFRRHPRTRLVTRLATPNSVVADLNPHAKSEAIKVRLLDRLERAQTRRSDGIISPSDNLADVVAHRWALPRERITNMPTGVDFALRNAARADRLPSELEGQEYLLFVGRLEERKGVHVLARALPQLLAEHPALRVVFAGINYLTYNGRSMREYIEQSNREHVDRLHFYAHASQPQLYPLYGHALFAVFPSLWESVPNVALEAIDMGTAVVGTAGCGIGEVVEHDRSGLLVPPGDVDALREAMRALLANRAWLQRLSDGARARARVFAQDAVAARLLGFYETLLPASETVAA